MKFIVLGNKSAFTYKGVFPLIKAVRVRVGATSINGGRWMIMPGGMDVSSLKAKTDASGRVLVNVPGVCWFTNLRHNVRRSLPPLKTMAENLASNKRLRKHLLEKYGRLEYPRYDNYAAIEVPFVDAIPSDYDGVMGVPVTFLDKWDPDGGAELVAPGEGNLAGDAGVGVNHRGRTDVAVNGGCVYCRLLIRSRHELVGATEDAGRGLAGDLLIGRGGAPAVGEAKMYRRLLIQPRHELVGARKGLDGADLRVGADTPYYRLLIRPAGA